MKIKMGIKVKKGFGQGEKMSCQFQNWSLFYFNDLPILAQFKTLFFTCARL